MSIIEDLQLLDCNMVVLENEPMAKHTPMHVGGPARYFVLPTTVEAIIAILDYAKKQKLSYYVVGNGSNLIVSDQGYDGLIIHIGSEFASIEVTDGVIKADAGASLGAIARVARENGLTGLEFAAGIPGTVGGAVLMNAGAYGGEMKDVVMHVTTVNASGKLCTYSVEELNYGYRHSLLMESGETIVSATFHLDQDDSMEIQRRMEDYASRRREKQPLEYPSAGSIFKRPEGHFAGALIEEAELKGQGVGGAYVSMKHAGFIVNVDHATAQDVYETIKLVQEKVKANSGVLLETEVKFLGEFA